MWKRMLLLCALVVSGMVGAAEPGTLSKAEVLRAKPFTDAVALSNLAAGSKVAIITRSGAWYQVKAGSKTGWVRMLSVRRSVAASGSSVAGLAKVASGRSGTGKVSTTTGVRGLDEQELDTASFNAAQIQQSERYRVSAKEAAVFARAGKLSLRDAQPLPAPVQE